jgi:hypothetical protein
MKKISYKGYRFPPEIVQQAIWLYVRFTLSFRDAEEHQAILDPELLQIVQDKLAANRQERALAVGAEAPSLLAGLIVDADGNL